MQRKPFPVNILALLDTKRVREVGGWETGWEALWKTRQRMATNYRNPGHLAAKNGNWQCALSLVLVCCLSLIFDRVCITLGDEIISEIKLRASRERRGMLLAL